MIDKSECLVLDVETNGLRSKDCDLLSISIYKPDDQKTFNKFLPLELNDCVLTTQFNGINDGDLANASHLTQAELDSIIEDFDVKNRTILHYGDLDPRFLREYLKRKGLKGFDLFNFFNIIFISHFKLEIHTTCIVAVVVRHHFVQNFTVRQSNTIVVLSCNRYIQKVNTRN